MQSLYLLVNIFTILLPFAFSFHPRLAFHKKWWAYLPSMLLAGIPFLIWDSFFTKWEIWGFNPDYLTGFFLLNLPLEEVLFFVCIPYACVFTYHSLNILLFDKQKLSIEIVSPILIAFLVVLAFMYKDRLYTFTTFSSLAFLILLSKYFLGIKWLKKFYISYSILLLPFFIVNGILTGSGLENPVVWYNEKELIGLKLLSIPIEDIFYGMELIFLNLLIYHYIAGIKSNPMKKKLKSH